MINLLPPDIRENLRFAQRNTVLLKWTLGLLAGVFGIMIITAAGWLYMNREAASYVAIVNDATGQLKEQNLGAVQQQISTISSNLKLAVQVLSREVLFSQLLEQIGKALPPGAVLTDLNIAQVSGGLDLQAAATNYQTATQIQVNLQDPQNNIFSKADIVSIQCQSSASGSGSTGSSFSSAYPCQTDIRAQFAANNPYLFINSKGTAP